MRYASCRNVSQLSYSIKTSRIWSRIRSGSNITCTQSFFSGLDATSASTHGCGDCDVEPNRVSSSMYKQYIQSPWQRQPILCSRSTVENHSTQVPTVRP